MVAQVWNVAEDTTRRLKCGDIVYVDSVHPCFVLRLGDGNYEKEVRVADVNENLTDWTVTMWNVGRQIGCSSWRCGRRDCARKTGKP